MAEQDIATHYPQINAAANRFLNSLGPAFTDTPTGHIETDIAGAASIAGLLLLRAMGIELSQYAPGSILLSEIHAAQEELLRFMTTVAYNMGLEPAQGWDAPIPPQHRPLSDTLQLTRKLEPAFLAVCKDAGIPRDYYPHVAALAAMKLVAAGQNTHLLDAAIGKSLALYCVIAGSKIVPYPIET